MATKSIKKTVSMRLSEDTLKALDRLQRRFGRSASSVIALLVYAQDRGIKSDSEEFETLVNSPL